MKLYFVLSIITFSCALLGVILPLDIIVSIGNLNLYFLFGFVILHSSKAMGNKKTAIFMSMTFLFGLFSELIGVKFGWFYGNYYYTSSVPHFFFGLVPLAIPFTWTILMYIGYTLTNLLLVGFGGEKPKKTDNLWYLVTMIILLSFIGGLVALNLDMILDPVAILPPSPGWVWIHGGPYYGIPISNFVGWFLITAGVILIFRVYESFLEKTNSSRELDMLQYWYLIVIYLFYLLANAIKAFILGKSEYVLIGATTVGPFVLIALLALLIKFRVRDLK